MRLIERSDIRFSQTDWKTNQQMNVCYSRVAFSIEQAEKLKSREMKGGWMKNVEGWWFKDMISFGINNMNFKRLIDSNDRKIE